MLNVDEGLGLSRIVNCSVVVGVITVVVPPCHELLSSFTKLLRLPFVFSFLIDKGFGEDGGWGTTKHSSSTIGVGTRSTFATLQSSDSSNCVKILVVVGVRTESVLLTEAVSLAAISDSESRLTFWVFCTMVL